ncbi:ankyrin repeat domain-containing protein [Endozoicomonas sp. ONNA2]|uniref:ankyrin repeat domain-containing protein n=1 Tax=Endozoicomonas sp. ONNA2 TaxID=2828741 RepID=UPI00214836F1|nr:ankyrin repeat domain-containing protein [Endozoicomonas sp. ONNA2]
MDGVRDNTTGFSFKCSICLGDDGNIRGQHGGRSLVKTSCNPVPHVFHLECITEWLDRQRSESSLDQRKCICRQPALPLIRLDRSNVLDDDSDYCQSMMSNACHTGDLDTLRMLLSQDETLANKSFRSVLTGQPEHPLAIAINYGHSHCSRALIDCGADVNAAGHDGETPLYIAAQKRRTEDFNMLIRAGADINNVLHTAIRKSDAPLLEYLISTKPGQLALNNALREAAERGQTQCLEMLIRAGANNLDDALCAAAERWQNQCLTPLIKAGANALNRALYIVALSKNFEGWLVLAKHGANIITVIHTAAREGSLEFFNLWFVPRGINETDEKGQTPLHITAANGHGGCLTRLLEISTEKINARNNSGETALHLAVYNGHVGCLRPLIKHGANLNATNKNGETALHIATKININEVRQLWADMGRDINETLINGRTPKHYTNQQGNDDECLRELVDIRGVNINVTDNDGSTPLIIAAIWGKFDRLQWLIDAGADINAVANDGSTALYEAACWGRTDCLRKLLADHRIQVNQKMEKHGRTALHSAVCNGHKEIVKELLTDGRILVNKKDNDGDTALDLAIKYHHAACKKLLEDYGAKTSACVLQ